MRPAYDEFMPFRYELTSRTGPVSTWHATGPGLDLRGEGRRGYLTLPPLEFCEADGVVAARFGGNRRIAPSRHILQSPDGRVLANFGTHLVASVVETRGTIATDSEGNERCALVPVETEVTGIRNTLAAAVDGGYILTVVPRPSVGSGLSPTRGAVGLSAAPPTWQDRRCAGRETSRRSMSPAYWNPRSRSTGCW